MLGVGLGGFDEVRDQFKAPFEFHVDIGLGFFEMVAQTDEIIVGENEPNNRNKAKDCDNN